MTALPNFLYKYRSLSQIERISDVIVDHKLYFSSPFDFNDPFDCRPRIIVGQNLKECKDARRYIEGVLSKKLGLSRVDRRRRSFEIIAECREHDNLTDKYKILLARAGVYSVSAKADDPLMWSHYAAGHTGVCLGLSTSNNPFFSSAVEMIYSKNYPTIKLFQHGVDWGKESMRTKSEHWKYEDEWRLGSEKPGLLEMPPQALVKVILGCQISNENQEKVRALCAKSKCSIEISKASMHPTQYKLDFLKIDN